MPTLHPLSPFLPRRSVKESSRSPSGLKLPEWGDFNAAEGVDLVPSDLGVGGWDTGDGVMAGMALPLPSSIFDKEVSFPWLRRTMRELGNRNSLWMES